MLESFKVHKCQRIFLVHNLQLKWFLRQDLVICLVQTIVKISANNLKICSNSKKIYIHLLLN
jgi:hypothetical protein